MNRIFLSAEWRYLAMLNYAVDPALLQPLVPPGTELDSFGGTTYASIVGFRFLKTKVLGLPIPFHRDFDEVNLRFYVRKATPEGWRRGVVFVRELVPRWAIACVARVVYGEPYLALPMRHQIHHTPAGVSTSFEWRRHGIWESVRATATGEAQAIAPGSEAEFITEHYWGYTIRKGLLGWGDSRPATSEYQVEHPRWRVWQAATSSLQADVATLYGPQFVESLTAAPRSAFIAEGSPVAVRSYTPVPLPPPATK